jgi:hypothetical protein
LPVLFQANRENIFLYAQSIAYWCRRYWSKNRQELLSYLQFEVGFWQQLLLLLLLLFLFALHGAHDKSGWLLPHMLREAEQATPGASTRKTTPQSGSDTSPGSSGER